MNVLRDYLLEIILAIVFVFLLLVSVLPYFSGYKIQADYSDLIKTISNGTDFTFEVVSYERHWFRSDAKLVVKNVDKNILFEFKHQIIHGPLYLGLMLEGRLPFVNMVIQGDVLPKNVTDDYIVTALSSRFIVQMKAYVSFNGDVYANLSIPTKKVNKASVVTQAKKIDFELHYTERENRYKGEIHIPELLTYEHSFFELENLILSFDEVYKNDAVIGDLVVSFDLMKLKVKSRIIDFRKVSARFEHTIDKGLLDLDVNLNASKINLFNEQVNSLSLSLGLNDFDPFQINELGMSLDKYTFSSFSVKPLNFYSEHGTYAMTAQLNRKESASVDPLNYFSDKQSEIEVSINLKLFRRIYEIISSNIGVSTKNVDVFLRSMLKLKYLDLHLDKMKVKISGKNNIFTINDKKTDLDHLTDNFMSNILLN